MMLLRRAYCDATRYRFSDASFDFAARVMPPYDKIADADALIMILALPPAARYFLPPSLRLRHVTRCHFYTLTMPLTPLFSPPLLPPPMPMPLDAMLRLICRYAIYAFAPPPYLFFRVLLLECRRHDAYVYAAACACYARARVKARESPVYTMRCYAGLMFYAAIACRLFHSKKEISTYTQKRYSSNWRSSPSRRRFDMFSPRHAMLDVDFFFFHVLRRLLPCHITRHAVTPPPPERRTVLENRREHEYVE